jgi:dihydrofolate synthase/folylpolyglutamate synthase
VSAAPTRRTPPPSLRAEIIPWLLPTPDSLGSPAYLAALHRVYAFSERPRGRDEIALAQEKKLERMHLLLHQLGSPQTAFSAILVAGTKGKGSTAAVLASILSAAGFRVGRYTQPHLYSFRERTWAVGDFISETALVDTVDAMEEALAFVDRLRPELGPLTTFDVGTALAFLHFARSRVQLAVVEVGVGGANDATNVVEPVLGIVGPVGFDHMDVLGHTLPEIALQKFGIARRGNDLLVGRQASQVTQTLHAAAERERVRLHELGVAIDWRADDPCAGPFDVHSPLGDLSSLDLPIVGAFQRDNATLAVAAAQLLGHRGWIVPEDAIRRGVADVQWPGRFQTVVRDPLTIVDGAHNPISAAALAETLRARFPGRPATTVLGMTDTKDVAETIRALAPVARAFVLTRSSHSHAVPPADLLAAARALDLPASTAESPADALLEAWDARADGAPTLVTGSLFLVGDVLEWLRRLP